MARSCAITRSPYMPDDELFPWLLAPAPQGMGCKVRGWPFVELYDDGHLVSSTLPTMEAGLWEYDPFLRPLARGWKPKSWRYIALPPSSRTRIKPNTIDSIGDGWD
jgi:hypothetical protein